MGDLSPHFDRSEFRDHHDYTLPAGMPTLDLVHCLERLRGICGGRPLRILSGYRSPGTNRAVGGAPNSQHLTGNAADIPAGYATVQQCRQAGFTGIGVGLDHRVTHVDCRQGPAVTFPDPG